MKRFLKWLGAGIGCLGLFLLVACSNVSAKYADKINKAAKDGEAITLDQVRKDSGDDRVEIIILNSGVIISVKGCKKLEDLQTKLDNGEDVEGIVITVLASKATAAEYRKINVNDLKGGK